MLLLIKKYKSATGKILYVEDSQFNKVAEVFHKYLDMDEAYVKEQLAQPKSDPSFLWCKRKWDYLCQYDGY